MTNITHIHDHRPLDLDVIRAKVVSIAEQGGFDLPEPILPCEPDEFVVGGVAHVLVPAASMKHGVSAVELRIERAGKNTLYGRLLHDSAENNLTRGMAVVVSRVNVIQYDAPGEETIWD
jgi:hypothetical protein